jgi:hypothetical protein
LTLILLVSKLSGDITGGEITQKQVAPCTPTRINPGFAGSGRGSATVPTFVGPSLQIATVVALGQAVTNAFVKLSAHKARICGAAPCVAGCICTQNYSFTPPIVTPTINYFLWFIPVSVTVNVRFPYTGGYWCL